MAQDREAADTSVLTQLGINEREIARRLKIVGFTPEDREGLLALSEVVLAHVEEFTSSFFEFLSSLEEAAPFLRNTAALQAARKLKREHLLAMVSGEYGLKYVEERLRLGLLYAKAGLDPRAFLGAFHHLLKTIGRRVLQESRSDPTLGFDRFTCFSKVAFFDISLILDVISFERERVIRLQQEAIRELSTPVLQLRQELLILPMIGIVDTQRARQLTDSVLRAVREYRAKVVVFDITGVPVVDSKVANHLIQTISATRLMGARAIISGISTEVANALVTLGVDLSEFETVGDLQGGLEQAERLLGYQVIRQVEPLEYSPVGSNAQGD